MYTPIIVKIIYIANKFFPILYLTTRLDFALYVLLFNILLDITFPKIIQDKKVTTMPTVSSLIEKSRKKEYITDELVTKKKLIKTIIDGAVILKSVI